MSNAFSTVMSAADASAARAEARRAKDAAESVVDGQARFIVVPLAKLEVVEPGGFFSSGKYKLNGELCRLSIKHTDVANIVETTDSFGNKFAKLILEERAGEIYVEANDEYYTELKLNLSLADATALVNGEAKLT